MTAPTLVFDGLQSVNSYSLPNVGLIDSTLNGSPLRGYGHSASMPIFVVAWNGATFPRLSAVGVSSISVMVFSRRASIKPNTRATTKSRTITTPDPERMFIVSLTFCFCGTYRPSFWQSSDRPNGFARTKASNSSALRVVSGDKDPETRHNSTSRLVDLM